VKGRDKERACLALQKLEGGGGARDEIQGVNVGGCGPLIGG